MDASFQELSKGAVLASLLEAATDAHHCVKVQLHWWASVFEECGKFSDGHYLSQRTELVQ